MFRLEIGFVFSKSITTKRAKEQGGSTAAKRGGERDATAKSGGRCEGVEGSVVFVFLRAGKSDVI